MCVCVWGGGGGGGGGGERERVILQGRGPYLDVGIYTQMFARSFLSMLVFVAIRLYTLIPDLFFTSVQGQQGQNLAKISTVIILKSSMLINVHQCMYCCTCYSNECYAHLLHAIIMQGR